MDRRLLDALFLTHRNLRNFESVIEHCNGRCHGCVPYASMQLLSLRGELSRIECMCIYRRGVYEGCSF